MSGDWKMVDRVWAARWAAAVLAARPTERHLARTLLYLSKEIGEAVDELDDKLRDGGSDFDAGRRDALFDVASALIVVFESWTEMVYNG